MGHILEQRREDDKVINRLTGQQALPLLRLPFTTEYVVLNHASTCTTENMY
jgi:hypothetical protein